VNSCAQRGGAIFLRDFIIIIIWDECESHRAGGLGEYVECLGCRNKAAKVCTCARERILRLN
jgi:hypothetical protein